MYANIIGGALLIRLHVYRYVSHFCSELPFCLLRVIFPVTFPGVHYWLTWSLLDEHTVLTDLESLLCVMKPSEEHSCEYINTLTRFLSRSNMCVWRRNSSPWWTCTLLPVVSTAFMRSCVLQVMYAPYDAGWRGLMIVDAGQIVDAGYMGDLWFCVRCSDQA